MSHTIEPVPNYAGNSVCRECTRDRGVYVIWPCKFVVRADEREQAAQRVREVFCTCGECELDGAEAAAVFAAASGGEQA